MRMKDVAHPQATGTMGIDSLEVERPGTFTSMGTKRKARAIDIQWRKEAEVCWSVPLRIGSLAEEQPGIFTLADKVWE